MQLNRDIFEETLNKYWEEDMSGMCDNILSYSSKFCPVSPQMETALTLAAKESYLTALKTIERAVIASLE